VGEFGCGGGRCHGGLASCFVIVDFCWLVLSTTLKESQNMILKMLLVCLHVLHMHVKDNNTKSIEEGKVGDIHSPGEVAIISHHVYLLCFGCH